MPLAFALVLWFTATGAVLWLDRLPKDSWPASVLGATVASGVAMAAVIVTAPLGGHVAAYVAFAAGLVLWGWHELTFLMGFVTGPNRDVCPTGATGWRRFRLAAATLIHHEIAMFITLVALVAATWGQPNQTATLTFSLLFVMRLSAKLNIFAGVPHLSTEMIPEHMRYLTSYFRIGPARWFFAASIVGIAAIAGTLGRAALSAEGGLATGYALVFGLVLLAMIEHGFLVIPWRDTRIFRWAMSGGEKQQAAPRPASDRPIDHNNEGIALATLDFQRQ